MNRAEKREPSARVDELAHAVIGSAIEVHKHLGPGLLESMYENALCVELRSRGVPFEQQRPLDFRYKEQLIGQGRIDLLVGGCLIVEAKAIENLLPVHTAQVISYLRGAGLDLGLLINFNVHRLRDGVKRIACTD